VRRTFEEESNQGGIETSCFSSGNNATICQTFGRELLYNDNVALNGIEANKLIVISTIKEVVQIGVDTSATVSGCDEPAGRGLF
jgi:hypothetical protein